MGALAKLKDLLRPAYKRIYPASFSTRSYAQEGEDLIVAGLLPDTSAGFYVDVGCHHPHRFSNTYLLYRRGWSGLCIDPLPGTAAAFRRVRPRDTAIEAGIAREAGELKYFEFNEPALNTFDAELAGEQARRPGYRITKTAMMPTQPLATIFEQHRVGRIDFLTIDAEGLDLEVLQSNDWQRWRPAVVMAESLTTRLDQIQTDPMSLYMRDQEYCAVQKVGRNIIFIDTDGSCGAQA